MLYVVGILIFLDFLCWQQESSSSIRAAAVAGTFYDYYLTLTPAAMYCTYYIHTHTAAAASARPRHAAWVRAQ